METYNHSRKCPKCGGSDTGDSYHKGGECRYGRVKCAGTNEQDHIKRHCRRCHYEWAEATLDSAQS